MAASAWIFWTLAGVLALVGVAAIAGGLFWDRAHGRKRCPKCWYDFAGLTTLRCPECGREALSEKHLGLTRRRWRWVTAGVMVLIAAQTAPRVPGIRTRGWTAALPTTVLVVFAKDFEESTSLSKEAVWRLQRGTAPWDMWIALTRCMNQYDDAAFRSIIHVRDKWPVTEPLLVTIRPLPWDGRRTFANTRYRIMSPALPGDVGEMSSWPEHLYVFVSGIPKRHLLLPSPVLGENSIEVDVELTLSTDGVAVTRRRSFTIDVQGVPTLDEAVLPISSAELDSQVAACIRVHDSDNEMQQGHSRDLFVWIDTRRRTLPAICASFDIVCQGQSIASVNGSGFIDLNDPGLDECFDEHGMLKPGILTLHIRSLPKEALWHLDHDSYWHGEITRPLEYLLPIRE